MRNGNGVLSIPASSKEMVQSLKEIVNCPEHEIYAMLKECDMDPNDTVNRLLSQDPFHEVKSKREKKKVMKENTESRYHVVSGTSNRSRATSSADHDVRRGSSTKFRSNDSGVINSKAAYKKDNGANAVPNSSSVSGIPATDASRKSITFSEPISMETTVHEIGASDGISLSSKPSSGFQPAWLGAPDHVSMADIVKMGRPRANTSIMPTIATSHSSHQSAKHHLQPTHLPSDSHHVFHSAQDPAFKVSDIIHETSVAVTQDISPGDWPKVEKLPAATRPSVAEPSCASVIYEDPTASNLYIDRVSLHPTESDEVHVTGATVVESQMLGSNGSAAASDRQIQVDNYGGSSGFDDTSFKNSYPFQYQSPAFDHQEGYPDPASVKDISGAVSSAGAGLQQLSLQQEISAPPAGDNPAVIIPSHMQVPTPDCSHLSFGSFGPGNGAGFSSSFLSKTLKSISDEASTAPDDSSVEHLDSRNHETSKENVGPPSSSQPEVLKRDGAVEATHGHQYPLPSSQLSYVIESAAQVNAAGYSYSQTNSQMQSLSFSSVLPSSASSLPSNLLASAVQPVRESDFPYSQFTDTQPIPTNYSSGMTSISEPTISAPEVMKPSDFTTPQPSPQTLPSAMIPTGLAIPQHLAMHPYSHPTPFANVITYPFPHQSYTYVPSAFQQGYAANSVYHQSPATVQSTGIKYSLPQYKNGTSVGSLPQPAAVASGYGSFGGSTNIPESFQNPSTTKDINHYSSQQNEASIMWSNGSGSRSMSALPGSAYYGFRGQNQHGVIQPSHQPSHFGALGYSNFYHSQAGVPQEHQQTQNNRSLTASQGGPSQQSHQIWQHSH